MEESEEEHRPSSPDLDDDCRRSQSQNRASSLVGSYVRKDFPSDAAAGPTGAPSLLGKVTSHRGRLFTTLYEDGSCEYLDLPQIRQALLLEEGQPSPHNDDQAMLLLSRKRKLDHFISTGGETTRRTRSRIKAINVEEEEVVVEEEEEEDLDQPDASPSATANSLLDDDDSGSSSDSCISTHSQTSMLASQPIPSVPPPVLPLSSADIGIPEDVVPSLFSVFNFLRSFSHRLFLSPFRLDDFVGSLNCTLQNSLLDAIHVSLMRMLRHHLETLASEGSQRPSRCLKLLDWSLLDSLTWPVFLMEYIFVMGYTKQIEDCNGFFACILDRDYYMLTVPYKLLVLQILCDDVVDSADFRAELEMRENLDEEKDHNGSLSLCTAESGPRRVHPRYSKTSACKDTGKIQHMPTAEQSIYYSKLGELDDARTVEVDQDGNSDECQLCGMDGTLLCCDGCPSAYHPRCIGLYKASIPNGLWLCPECTVNKASTASSKASIGIRGAEILGIDPFGQVFLGTYNYLIVFDASYHATAKSICRYYNQNDIIKVLQILCSTKETSSLYAEICQAISLFWEIPLANFLRSGSSDTVSCLPVEKNNTISINSSSPSTVKLCPICLDNCEAENHASDTLANTAVKKELPFQHENSVIDSLANESCEATYNELSFKKKIGSADESSFPVTGAVQKNQSLRCLESHDQLEIVPMICSGKPNSPTDTSSDQPKSMNSPLLHCGASIGLADGPTREYLDITVSSTNDGSLGESHESRYGNHTRKGKSRDNRDRFSYMGTSLRRQAYVNQYIHGEVAASAAANFALVSSEENNVSVAQASSNPRKIIAAKTALQLKAFSSAAMHFMWPSSEKKTSDVPRERCGWCMVCKGENTNKRGCLLNTAVTNSIKGASRALASFRPVKNGNNSILAVAAYILHMEENLHGLVEGSLLDTNYNMQWRKSVKEASTCRVLKFLLLELERNIRGIAFSSGWLKLVDDWSTELSGADTSACSMGTHQKRGFGGRRKRKQPIAPEITSIDCDDSWKEVKWWRGGRLPKVLFQRGMLPCLLARRVARRGGSKEEFGVYYSDRAEVANRTRQIAWRTAVEMSRNACQLALQVRYLDAHIRWKDVVRPEQIALEGKAADVEASTFRNAIIFEKKMVENRVRYALAFSNQKHLPLRVMKNILESERGQDEKEKLWLSENHVPLYLIKEYEEKVAAVHVPCFMEVTKKFIPEIHKMQLKAISSDIFLYLFQKGEKPERYSCASCKEDILLRGAVTCMSCQGYCHEHCLITAAYGMNAGLEFTLMCNPCYQAESSISSEKHNECLNDSMIPVVTTKEPFPCNSLMQLANTGVNSEIRSFSYAPSSEQKGKSMTRFTSGLIWKKKSDNIGIGEEFRLKHLILRGDTGMQTLIEEPRCTLCSAPYNPDLMYIRCEKCLKWYHAESVHLKEDHIFELVGFRCCKCRRRASPQCPYMDENDKRFKSKLGKQSKADRIHGSNTCEMPKLVQVIRMSQPKSSDTVVSPNSMEQLQPNATYPVSKGQHQLSIRLHASHGTTDASPAAHAMNKEITGKPPVLPAEVNLEQELDLEGSSTIPNANTMLTSDYTSAQQVDLDFSRVNCNLSVSESHIKYGSVEDMEYEPQTYFSFTELLASGDDELGFLCDMPVIVPENLDTWSGYDEEGSVQVQAISSYNLEPPPEIAAVEKHGVDSGGAVALNGAVCHKCNLNDNAPDVMCEICGLMIHLHCSPWEELENPGKVTWRCGACREWQ